MAPFFNQSYRFFICFIWNINNELIFYDKIIELSPDSTTSQQTTRQPSLANPRTSGRPIPPPAPVRRTIWPLIFLARYYTGMSCFTMVSTMFQTIIKMVLKYWSKTFILVIAKENLSSTGSTVLWLELTWKSQEKRTTARLQIVYNHETIFFAIALDIYIVESHLIYYLYSFQIHNIMSWNCYNL